MIAVFCSRFQWQKLHVVPSLLIWVRELKDIDGRTFEGVITFMDYELTAEQSEAFEVLRSLQPRLFK